MCGARRRSQTETSTALHHGAFVGSFDYSRRPRGNSFLQCLCPGTGRFQDCWYVFVDSHDAGNTRRATSRLRSSICVGLSNNRCDCRQQVTVLDELMDLLK